MTRKALACTLKLTSAALLWGPFFCPNAACQTPHKKLQVVILAVTDFKDHDLDNSRLELSIKRSSEDLQHYFAQHFPQAEVHLIKQTDIGSIRAFISDDFRPIADGNVTLFFVISHGFADSHPNPAYKNDLLIAATDTVSSTRANTLSVAKELVPAFTSLDVPGSIVLLFLDTCYSGAAQNLNIKTAVAGAEDYGLRIMILASALSDSQAFRATLSEALIDLWNAHRSACTDPQQAPAQLRQFIINRLRPETIGKNEPKLITPFLGQFCMESFAAERGLFVFFNASPDRVDATIQSNGKPIDDVSFPLPLLSNEVVPFSAPRDLYTVTFQRKDGTPIFAPLSANLGEEPIKFVPLDATTAELAHGFVQTAKYVTQIGLPRSESISYQKRAFAAFASVKAQDSAFDTASQIIASQPEDSDVKLAQKLAFPSTVSYSPVSHFAQWFFGVSVLCILLIVLSSVSFAQNPPLRQKYVRTHRATEIVAALALVTATTLFFSFSWPSDLLTELLQVRYDPASVAKVEKLAGQFDKAADLYSKAALSPPKGIDPQSLALQAYFAYGASGQIKKAEEFRRKNHLVVLERECPACIDREQGALREPDQGIAHQQFSSLCTVRALSKLNF